MLFLIYFNGQYNNRPLHVYAVVNYSIITSGASPELSSLAIYIYYTTHTYTYTLLYMILGFTDCCSQTIPSYCQQLGHHKKDHATSKF